MHTCTVILSTHSLILYEGLQGGRATEQREREGETTDEEKSACG
jgi:hypothetical protein